MEILENATLAELLDELELTSGIRTEEVAMVRDWIMDEIERRVPEAFNKWIDDMADDSELKYYIGE